MVPGSGAGVPENGLLSETDAAAVTSSQFKSATVPRPPFASATTVRTCVPAGRLTPLFVTVFQIVQPPVSGSASGPVTSAPSIATCTVPPVPLDATRKPSVYVPADAMLTV